MTRLKTPVRVTDFAVQCLRARLSLGETQTEFAKRFLTSRQTIVNWERGKVIRPQAPIHAHILDRITHNLDAERRLVPREQVETMFREALLRSGNAER